ncbi:hypothetical protein NPIL_57821 [Nephila pilipes]|uniref:Uncharacterized protein n=1 Tax=Nephila pilipes TaxID=299642 RepID=A0A8X6QP75_NEPPI|nr:hypothetical protein NPIL_57821 [Nephila pilipes]
MVTDMIAPAIDSFEVETRVLVPFTIGHAMDLMNVKLIRRSRMLLDPVFGVIQEEYIDEQKGSLCNNVGSKSSKQP